MFKSVRAAALFLRFARARAIVTTKLLLAPPTRQRGPGMLSRHARGSGAESQASFRKVTVGRASKAAHDPLSLGIALNTTASLGPAGGAGSVVGSKTEGALLLALRDWFGTVRAHTSSLYSNCTW